MSDNQKYREFLIEAEDTDINDKGEECFGIDPILDKIGKTIEEQRGHGETSGGEIVSENLDLLNSLSDYEVYRLRENLKHGASLYKIKASFSVDAIDEDIARLQVRLRRFGEVIAFIPASGFSGEKWISFEIIFASTEVRSEDDIDDILKDNRINIHRIELIDPPGQEPVIAENKSDDISEKSIIRTVRVSTEGLDVLLNNVGEIVLLNDIISQALKDLKRQYRDDRCILDIHKMSKELCKRLTVLRHDLIEIRMVPISHLFDRQKKIVEKLCKDLSKEIKMEVCGGDNKLDKSMIEGLLDPLMHIVRNAVDHGIENEEVRLAAGKSKTGTISLRASHKGSRILIEVEDDGGGVDFKKIYSIVLERGLISKEDEIDEKGLIRFLFQPGFSTSDTLNEVSGRGTGLDIVVRNIASLRGMMDVETKSGKGTKFSITIPLTLLIAKALIVKESGKSFAIPLNTISENCILKNKEIKRIGEGEVLNVRGHFIPLVRLCKVLRFSNENNEGGRSCREGKQYVIVVGLGEKRAGLVVDAIEGQREVLLKPMSELLGVVPGIAGFTEIDAKKILPVIDVGGILDKFSIG